MKFSEHLWKITEPIYQEIIQHPFNTELADGTLDEKRFIFYIKQDSYYLSNFSRALAFIAAKTDSSTTIQQFLNFSLEALIGERELLASFLPPHYDCDKIEPSPSCIAYTQFLIAKTATGSIEEAISAVLPCFWIYREVGLHVASRCVPNNPYMKWIEAYSSQEFSDGTKQAISLLDKIASYSSVETLKKMEKIFEYSSLFEWHFWNDAYKMLGFKDSIKEGQDFVKV